MPTPVAGPSTVASSGAAAAFNAVPRCAAGPSPRSTRASSSAPCASSCPEFSRGYRRVFEAMAEAPSERCGGSPLEIARAAVRLRHEEGLLVVGIDLAGREKGYPPRTTTPPTRSRTRPSCGKTVHAGEAYGPESIFQAIGELHADRIGHGTFLFDAEQIANPLVDDATATSSTWPSTSPTSAPRSRSA